MSVLLEICNSSVWSAVKKLKHDKMVYIHAWKRSYGTRGMWSPRWRLGNQQDKIKPRVDRAADNIRYREKLDPMVRSLRWKKYRGKLNVWTLLRRP